MELTTYAIICPNSGKVQVSQKVECSTCGYTEVGYLNMNFVDKEDNIVELLCCICGEESLRVVTYRDNFPEIGE